METGVKDSRKAESSKEMKILFVMDTVEKSGFEGIKKSAHATFEMDVVCAPDDQKQASVAIKDVVKNLDEDENVIGFRLSAKTTMWSDEIAVELKEFYSKNVPDSTPTGLL